MLNMREMIGMDNSMHKNKKMIFFLFPVLPCLILVIITFLRIPIIEQMENVFLDGYISHMDVPSSKEKIILIVGSDRSIEKIGSWPWSREQHARLLEEYLMEAKTVGMDILFLDETDPEIDARFAAAIRKHGNVILAYAEAEEGKKAIHSLNSLLEAATGEGFTNGIPDADQKVRRYRLIREEALISPSFATAILMASGYNIGWGFNGNGTVDLTIEGNGETYHSVLAEDFSFFRFPAPRDSFQIYEYADVMEGKVPKEVFEDAIVFVVMNAAGAADVVTAAEGLVLGVQYNIDSMVTLLAGRNPLRAGRLVECLYVIALYTVAYLSSHYTKKRRYWFLAVLPVAVILLNRFMFMKLLIWMGVLPALLAVAVGYLSSLLVRLITSQGKITAQTMSIDALYRLGNSFTGEMKYRSFAEYIEDLGQKIKVTYEIEIIKAEALPEDEEMDGYKGNIGADMLTVAYHTGKEPFKHKIFLRLPVMGKEKSQTRYTVMGMKRRHDEMSIKAVGTMIANAYIYFNASREAAERTQFLYELIQCMIAAIDAKDPITSGHSQRVAEISEFIAESLGLPAEQVEQIKFAGTIHDLGKIGIPDNVLSKPGPYSEEDVRIMKEHPVKGYSIVGHMDLEPEILDGILYHHERIDGKGYPYGKTGDELSVTAKIVKIADVYDALISERQYKKAWPLNRVLNLFYENSGTEFDKDITKVFLDKIKPENWQPGGTGSGEGVGGHDISRCLEIYQEFLAIFHKSNIEKDQFVLQPVNSGWGTDFTCKNSFFDISWYEGTMETDLLMKRPAVIHVEKDEMFFALKGMGEIEYIIYCFFKGYLAAGYVIGSQSMVEEVQGYLGEAIARTADCIIYDKGKMNVICGENTVMYLMKSILER